jgi:hypothetical protein
MNLTDTIHGIPVWVLLLIAAILWILVTVVFFKIYRFIFPYFAKNREIRRLRKYAKKDVKLTRKLFR